MYFIDGKIFSEEDRKGQEKAVNFIKKIYKKENIEIENIVQHFDDSYKLDLEWTAITGNNRYECWAECKDRKMPSNRYDEYILEKGKIKEIKGRIEKGYRVYYINTFQDNKIIIWDMNKNINNIVYKEKYILAKNHTVVKDENKHKINTFINKKYGKIFDMNE